MSETSESELLTPEQIASKLSTSLAKVKHTIKKLGIEPARHEGRLHLYDHRAVQKIAFLVR